MKICDSSASISISLVLKRLSKRHFSHYKNFSKIAFKPLASVVCREFPGLRSAQMDVSRVLACVDSVMTRSLLSEYFAGKENVDVIADIIQSRVIAWVVQLETTLKLCKTSSKKPSRVIDT